MFILACLGGLFDGFSAAANSRPRIQSIWARLMAMSGVADLLAFCPLIISCFETPKPPGDTQVTMVMTVSCRSDYFLPWGWERGSPK